MKSAKTLFSVLLSILALLGCLLILNPIEKDSQSKIALNQKLPQEYMTKAEVWSFTETGQLKNELNADFWAFIPEHQMSRLVKPHLTIYKPDASIWRIDARKGEVLQPSIGTIVELQLNDNVVLQRDASKTLSPIKLETSELRYQPKNQYAETEKQITMTKPDLKITSTGMRAFLDKNTVELLEDVKTYFVANQK